MGNLTIRIDDVSENTLYQDLIWQLGVWRKMGARIICGINVFCKEAKSGSVYPDLPLSNHPSRYFFDVDKVWEFGRIFNGIDIASHGLVHADHSKLSRDAQEMSILTSCSILRSKLFIPPFNRINEETVRICADNGIEIIGNCANRIWKSLEFEAFDATHEFWYYHPWRMPYLKIMAATGQLTCGDDFLDSTA